MARTTATEVRQIITTDLLDAGIEVYIEIASTLIAQHVTCGLSDAVLEEIERQLTAHLIYVQDTGNVIEEKLGEATVKYSSTIAQGLNSTSYGRTALMLDTCGGLANAGKKTVSIKAVTSFES